MEKKVISYIKYKNKFRKNSLYFFGKHTNSEDSFFKTFNKIVKEKNHDKKKPSDFIANINKKSFFFKSFISFLKKKILRQNQKKLDI